MALDKGFVPAAGENDGPRLADAIRQIHQNAASQASLSSLSSSVSSLSTTVTSLSATVSALSFKVPPGGRLTLVSGSPVMTTTQTAKTTIYYTPYISTSVPVYNGTSTQIYDTAGEISLALDSDSGHTGYQQSGKNFDLFYAYVAGTLYFGTGPAWTSDTARATALEYRNGVRANGASMTLRHGSASGNTVTVPQGQGTFLGTMRASADGQCQFVVGGSASGGTAASLNLVNYSNRVFFAAAVYDNGANYTYTAGPRQARASAGNQVSFLSCDGEYGITASYAAEFLTSANQDDRGYMAASLDSTSTYSHGFMVISTNANSVQRIGSTHSANMFPSAGWHYVAAIEGASGGGFSVTFDYESKNVLSVGIFV